MTASERLNDWKWQYAHRILTSEALSKVIPLSDEEKADIDRCLESFRMAITPYYASLIDPNDPNDPIRMQAVPSGRELEECPDDMADPLGEIGDSPVPHVVHRYPDRVLLLVTYQCAMYCRHCTRRRAVGEEDRVIPERALARALDYIRSHGEIRDVLVSGGDPLTMATDRLERILSAIRAIPHVEVIRIGTRVPVVLPMRVTPELTDMLRKYHPVWINTHFNHPKEITPEARLACELLVDAGIPLGNQSVLLKGVNDSAEIMKELLLKLVKMRVRPYYLYQCDLSRGIAHFRTRVETGVDILHALTGRISGYALPRYVIDAPGGGGKIPVQYEYVMKKDDEEVLLENFQGKVFRYPQPKR